MRIRFEVILACMAAFFMIGTCQAQEFSNSRNDVAQLGFSTGIFNITADDAAAEMRLDYRDNHALLGFLRPIGGVMVTSDGDVHGYGGLMADVLWNAHFATSFYSSAGAYHHGDGEDLGHWIEFRSGVEVSYRFDDKSRVGLGFAHISNADIGDRNPGAEVLSLTYTVPVKALF
ncbi:acyloxyacyl hydrolase [Thalassospira mesophila]|uniref:Deacylase n=1 Tax=Thalassospira mesophila TaxID=1293891 RepID=A0A1Y2L5T4_9PROT|nr:acyloxyacyl hydrolase [Thalassospira mesophila]OSQ41031.1 deacylase [Thalassospira mesophila]